MLGSVLDFIVLMFNVYFQTADSLLHGLFGHGLLDGVSDIYNKYPFAVPSAETTAEEDVKQKMNPEMAFKKRILGDRGSAFLGTLSTNDTSE